LFVASRSYQNAIASVPKPPSYRTPIICLTRALPRKAGPGQNCLQMACCLKTGNCLAWAGQAVQTGGERAACSRTHSDQTWSSSSLDEDSSAASGLRLLPPNTQAVVDSRPTPVQPSPAQHSVTHHTCKAHAPTLKLLKYRPPTGERALGPGVLLPVPRPHLLELPAASPAPPQPPQGRPHQSTANTRLNPLLPTTGVTYDRFYGLRKPRALSASR